MEIIFLKLSNVILIVLEIGINLQITYQPLLNSAVSSHLNHQTNLISVKYANKIILLHPVSVAQLVATMNIICRGRDSNTGFPTSPHIMCVNLTTRLPDQKKKKITLLHLGANNLLKRPYVIP